MDTIQKDDVSRDPYGSVGGCALHALKEVMQRALAVVAPLRQRVLLQEIEALDDLDAVVGRRAAVDRVPTVRRRHRLQPPESPDTNTDTDKHLFHQQSDEIDAKLRRNS